MNQKTLTTSILMLFIFMMTECTFNSPKFSIDEINIRFKHSTESSYKNTKKNQKLLVENHIT